MTLLGGSLQFKAGDLAPARRVTFGGSLAGHLRCSLERVTFKFNVGDAQHVCPQTHNRNKRPISKAFSTPAAAADRVTDPRLCPMSCSIRDSASPLIKLSQRSRSSLAKPGKPLPPQWVNIFDQNDEKQIASSNLSLTESVWLRWCLQLRPHRSRAAPRRNPKVAPEAQLTPHLNTSRFQKRGRLRGNGRHQLRIGIRLASQFPI